VFVDADAVFTDDLSVYAVVRDVVLILVVVFCAFGIVVLASCFSLFSFALLVVEFFLVVLFLCSGGR
jgi:hypothetical protein